MRVLLILMMFPLCGCESLGDVIREEKYTIQFNETPHTIQSFGYNDDLGYVGFMIEGEFGEVK